VPLGGTPGQLVVVELRMVLHCRLGGRASVPSRRRVCRLGHDKSRRLV